ncbi:MAG: ATP-binding protein [Candidatus Omnitrophota bacterium]|nr:MAG: ATP-binding protein [Candidatus Omnitrophota bacterium]
MLKRYLEPYIKKDLEERMVFIGGARQVGKTTLSQQIGNLYYPDNFCYFNWDWRVDRKAIINEEFPADKKLFIFDEIHKYRRWKNFLKGFYDKNKKKIKILVTGSSRLDIYRRGGDSLLGRYRFLRLHPLSLREIVGFLKSDIKPFTPLSFPKKIDDKIQKVFNRLLKFGGFPEVYLKNDEVFLRRWHNERIERIIREDIREIETIRDISMLEVLVELLPERVGSILSLNSLREELEVSFKSVKLWMDILERFYYHFRLYPYQTKKIKALKKEPKLYFWDWSEIQKESARFENMIASHLLKFVHFLYDVYGWRAELFYLRDVEKREVDFLVVIDRKVWFAVEVKLSSSDLSKNLKYFAQKLKIPFLYQVVKEEGIDFLRQNTRIISAGKFLMGLV